MGVGSSQARVAELAFRVFNRAVHPDWFATRVHRRLSQDRWEADVRIIEGGHVVSFGAGPVRLTEVLCGPATPLPEPGLLFQSSIRAERSASLQAGGLVEFQTCFEAERVDGEIFRHLCDEVVADASRHGILHHFRTTNRLLPAPLTHIHIEPSVRGLAIQSFHTFPEECAIVRTQSLYELIRQDAERRRGPRAK